MKSISNRRGQIAVEYVLILGIIFIFAKVFANYMSKNEILAGWISAPWAVLSGVIENGVPLPPEKGRALHPNHLQRHASLRGKYEN